jgi:hypothetical protein
MHERAARVAGVVEADSANARSRHECFPLVRHGLRVGLFSEFIAHQVADVLVLVPGPAALGGL